ncbi:MAG: MscL family protein [Bacilli bacterium]|nr:MscL family protein [Bacilli bacterium]
MAKKNKVGGLLSEFKAFISRGNVLDMAIGVVIGGAFSAIVTAVVNILLSVCTWTVPGGLASLVTILPAVGSTQSTTVAGWANGAAFQAFSADKFNDLAELVGTNAGAADPVTYGTNYLNANFTKHGGVWVWNGAAIINWGAVINAVISFLIIAIILFIIVKVAAKVRKTNDEIKAKAQEAYWEKHPEERPAPVEPDAPEPTDHELLKEMLKVMKENQASKK